MATRKGSKKAGSKKTTDKPISRRQCGTMQSHFQLLESDPDFRARQTSLEHATARRMSLGGDAFLKTKGPMTVAVVVHIVYNTAEQNISVAQINSQIKVLNKDFRATNTDKSKVPMPWKGFVGNTNLKFVLAKKDPQGNATTGITRTQTTRTSFGTNNSVKSNATGGASPWPTNRYLNIWVTNLSGGLLGYAQFPGGPAATDGVVIHYKAFGTNGTAAPPFNLGRSATHEIGHFFNLRHIWGDTADCSGTDSVNDTPNAAGPNFGKPVFPHVTCGNGPNGDMFVNYMDYSDDDAMFMFTLEQVARMHAAIDAERDTLVNP